MRVFEQIFIAAVLALISIGMYYLEIRTFQNPHDTIFYLMQDLAFVPIQVLLISMLINRILSLREKQALLKKLNMLIGVFFSEVGTRLVELCSDFESNSIDLKKSLLINESWNKHQFQDATKHIKQYKFCMNAAKGDLLALQKILVDKRQFLTGFLANPNLLEHDTFSDLVWSVLHLAEELELRSDFNNLPQNDKAHIAVDIERVYSLLLQEWLAYMSHLQTDYPYLYSLAVRKNPLKDEKSVIIQ